jgi:hypothetical protein
MKIGTGAKSAKELAQNMERDLGPGMEELYQQYPELRPKGDAETKAVDNSGVQAYTPWADKDLDELTETDEETVKRTLASRGAEMRNILEAKQDE